MPNAKDLAARLRNAALGGTNRHALDSEAADLIEQQQNNIDNMRLQLDEQAAEIEHLRADAERYRWLRGGPDVPPESNRWARWEVRHWRGRWWNTMFAEALDAAIDAARKGTT